MSDGTDQRRELNHLMLNLLEEWRGQWVQGISGSGPFGIVGRVVDVHRDAMSVEFERITGGRFVAPVGVYLGVELLGPEQQRILNTQAAENREAERRIWQ